MNPIVVPILMLLAPKPRRKIARVHDGRQRCIRIGGPPPSSVKKDRGRVTMFPWDQDRVCMWCERIVESVSDIEDFDLDGAALKVAERVYPVHPISGDAFDWDGADDDLGAQLIIERIKNRLMVLVAQRREAEAERLVEERLGPQPVVGFAPPEDSVAAIDPDEYQENGLSEVGRFVRVRDGDDLRDMARAALSRSCGRVNRKMVEEYVSLIASSPYNDAIVKAEWDRNHRCPTYPKGAWRSGEVVLWFPRINTDLADQAVVTCYGTEWPDGTTGLMPPPGVCDD